MNTGKQMRLRRLFNPQTNRMVLVTADHGICVNPMTEISKPAEVVRKVAAGGADAILLTPGIARRVYPEYLNTQPALLLILRRKGPAACQAHSGYSSSSSCSWSSMRMS